MSYLVLARKWRPKNFSETVGQEHVLQALINALDSERLHHAYLFSGTRGVGKTTIARILAKALNCETGITSSPCGKCSACVEIDEGRFVDLIEVDAASRTKVDDTRELLDNVQYAPAIGRFKVYLIDEVHMLSKSSFNALLKTLEEPPPHIKFLLATTDPQKLPVTVLSRCLQFNLKRLIPTLIKDRLSHICKAENVKTETAALTMLARAADGSLRDALSLLDQAIAYGGGEVLEEPVGVMLGTIDRQHVSKLLRLLASGDASGLLNAIAEIDQQFPDYARLLDDLARYLQRTAVYQVVGATDLEDECIEDELSELSTNIAAEDIQLFYQIALLGRRDLHLAPDPKSGVDMTLLRMLAFQLPGISKNSNADNPGYQTKSSSIGDVRSKSTASTPLTVKVDAPVKQKSEWKIPDWSMLINELHLTGANKLLASNCAYSHYENRTLYFNLDSRSVSLLTKSRQKALATAISDKFGEPLRVEITVANSDSETPVQVEARRVDEKMEAARVSLESDPNVKALQDMFGAQLNPDSIELINQSSGEKQSTDEQPPSTD
ncbi:DNA polymerase III subunit gamma/tau [Woeseiaceae bacterium]|nr:DNA polymerase III subunit gamma/tau [Woeseiaceae bacterium]